LIHDAQFASEHKLFVLAIATLRIDQALAGQVSKKGAEGTSISEAGDR